MDGQPCTAVPQPGRACLSSAAEGGGGLRWHSAVRACVRDNRERRVCERASVLGAACLGAHTLGLSEDGTGRQQHSTVQQQRQSAFQAGHPCMAGALGGIELAHIVLAAAAAAEFVAAGGAGSGSSWGISYMLVGSARWTGCVCMCWGILGPGGSGAESVSTLDVPLFIVSPQRVAAAAWPKEKQRAMRGWGVVGQGQGATRRGSAPATPPRPFSPALAFSLPPTRERSALAPCPPPWFDLASRRLSATLPRSAACLQQRQLSCRRALRQWRGSGSVCSGM